MGKSRPEQTCNQIEAKGKFEPALCDAAKRIDGLDPRKADIGFRKAGSPCPFTAGHLTLMPTPKI